MFKEMYLYHLSLHLYFQIKIEMELIQILLKDLFFLQILMVIYLIMYLL